MKHTTIYSLLASLFISMGQLLYADTESKASPESAAFFFKSHLPMRDDGKIFIPAEIKRVRLDIGLSYTANMSQAWLREDSSLIVFGFEPNQDALAFVRGEEIPEEKIPSYVSRFWIEKARQILPELLGKRFFVLPCALGCLDAQSINFFITENDCGCSSMYVPKFFPIEKQITVPCFRLSDFFDLFPFDTHPLIDYIKVDAQGADLDIAKGGGAYLTEHVVCITLEAEQNQYADTHNSETEMDAYMKSINFIRHRTHRATDPTYVNSRFKDFFIQNHELGIFQR